MVSDASDLLFCRSSPLFSVGGLCDVITSSRQGGYYRDGGLLCFVALFIMRRLGDSDADGIMEEMH